ncbi:hypothetical protein [Nocardia sp. NPDC059239]|uniref:hypothetical protein n=1 Tax=unclassified Nocardia TaxID=2637762 RepID=UPI0036C8FA9A
MRNFSGDNTPESAEECRPQRGNRGRVDVLDDRRAESLTAWLRAHPGVEIVCRDTEEPIRQRVRPEGNRFHHPASPDQYVTVTY